MRPSSHEALANRIERFERELRSVALAVAHEIIRAECERRRPAPVVRVVAEAPRREAKKPATPPPPVKKRWHRDAIIVELAGWLASGTTIDATFVKRHGPRGLVPAALREFGRFEAALNVAALRVPELYPEAK